MALRSPSSTPRRDLAPRDSPPAGSPPLTSQGGSHNRTRADVANKATEVEHLLTNLEKEGVVINEKIISIIDDEAARIKAEAARENIIINELKLIGEAARDTMACIVVGFLVGAKFYEHMFQATVDKIFFG